MIIRVRPSHGAWCGGRTIPVDCRYCGQSIYWYSCNCGCSILFEELGGGWPVHRCERYLAILDPTRSDLTTMTRARLLIGFDVAEDFELEFASHRTKPSRAVDEIRAVLPDGGGVEVVGIVTEIVVEPERLARYAPHRSSAVSARDFARLFGKGAIQVTVLCNADDGGRLSYTLIVKRERVARGIRRGDLVRASLRTDRLGLDRVWAAHDLERLY